eukprot:g71761.t1
MHLSLFTSFFLRPSLRFLSGQRKKQQMEQIYVSLQVSNISPSCLNSAENIVSIVCNIAGHSSGRYNEFLLRTLLLQCHIHSLIEPDWSDNIAVHLTLICDYDPFEPPFNPWNSYTDFVNAVLSSAMTSAVTPTFRTQTSDRAIFARGLAVNYHIVNTLIQLAIMHAISNVNEWGDRVTVTIMDACRYRFVRVTDPIQQVWN